MKYDGHVHTPYCPHGSNDSFEEYLEQAIKHGFSEISFTEHAPLPKGFTDPTPDQDSGMDWRDIEGYIKNITDLKRRYQKDIKINLGFEIDFIQQFEKETESFLYDYSPYIDDSILSVHFLQYEEEYFCLDFSEDEFERMIAIFGSVDHIYSCYFQTLKQSILSNLGPFKPKRIGHITLVQKFQKKFPHSKPFTDEILEILDLIEDKGLQLDYNGAGTVKPFCQEPYPPNWIIEKAKQKRIPLIYGSDAHSANGINQGFQDLLYANSLSSPTG